MRNYLIRRPTHLLGLPQKKLRKKAKKPLVAKFPCRFGQGDLISTLVKNGRRIYLVLRPPRLVSLGRRLWALDLLMFKDGTMAGKRRKYITNSEARKRWKLIERTETVPSQDPPLTELVDCATKKLEV